MRCGVGELGAWRDVVPGMPLGYGAKPDSFHTEPSNAQYNAQRNATARGISSDHIEPSHFSPLASSRGRHTPPVAASLTIKSLRFGIEGGHIM